MPSFIASNPDLALAQQREKASLFGIRVSSYKATNKNCPSSEEFNQLLNDFQSFCEENKESTCDMLLFTGYHGEYSTSRMDIKQRKHIDKGGLLNNLNMEQLRSLINVAIQHKVTFKHILADACCSAFGLKHLTDILAEDGESIGDITTSTAHRMHDGLFDKMSIMTPESHTEQTLINSTIECTLKSYNAPLYITKKDQQITAIATTVDEVKGHFEKALIDAGVTTESLVHNNGAFYPEFRNITTDNFNLKKLFRLIGKFVEENNRDNLVIARKNHMKASEQGSLAKKELETLPQAVEKDEPKQNLPPSKLEAKAKEAQANKWDKSLKLLDAKIDDLESRRTNVRDANSTKYKELSKAWAAAVKLKQNLTTERATYDRNPSESRLNEFKINCSKHIKTAHQTLDKHRGWLEFLINLALGIGTVGVGLLVKGAINIANNNSFFFTHRTQSAKILDDLANNLADSFKVPPRG